MLNSNEHEIDPAHVKMTRIVEILTLMSKLNLMLNCVLFLNVSIFMSSLNFKLR